MSVDPDTRPHGPSTTGSTFFCSAGCRTKFLADPRALSDAPQRHASAPRCRPATIYTCPMHPQIRQEGPGSCPICGMALEPLTVTAEAGPTMNWPT